MTIPTSIFKAYDIRGLVETELSAELAYRVGRAFVQLLKQKNLLPDEASLVVGRDMRPSSIEFQKKVMQGMQDEGINVIDIGMVSTPLFYFACVNYPAHAGGIMVTASHNPAEYNGFKMCLGSGIAIGKETGMDVIQDLVLKNNFEKNSATGTITNKNVLVDYEHKLFSLVDTTKIKSLHLVIDAGNGMGEVTFPDWLKKLPVTVEYLYLEPDGTFPNHEANPLKIETLKDLQKKVVESKADFGLALDGDCDRIGLVDEKGSVVEASYVGALIGLEVLKKHPGSHLMYDLRSSKIVKEVWEAHGATTEMSQVGHANIKKAMQNNGAVFASELSQHFYFNDLKNVESSDLCLLYVLELLSREEKTLSQLVMPLKKYFHSGEINFTVQDKSAVLARLAEVYTKSAQTTSELDGLWFGFEWGWFNVRVSNTEPVLRLNLEANAEDLMREKVKEVSGVIEE
jgi:phosphomannomutase